LVLILTIAIRTLITAALQTMGGSMKHAWIQNEAGERGRNRTYNLLIKSQLLCQLSYAPHVGTSADQTSTADEEI
jgi:hypothetical protein